MDDDRDPDIPPLPRRWVTWVVGGVLGALAVVAVVALTVRGGPDSNGILVDQAIQAVVPQPDTQVPRQTRVGIRLASGWGLDLMTIGSRPIPPDQIEHREALNEWFFEPGPGTALQRLDAGVVCVTVEISRVIDPPESRTNGWCFNAV